MEQPTEKSAKRSSVVTSVEVAQDFETGEKVNSKSGFHQRRKSSIFASIQPVPEHDEDDKVNSKNSNPQHRKPSIFTSVAAVPESDVDEKVNPKTGFFQRRRNRILITITGILIVILVILTPTIHHFYSRSKNQASSTTTSSSSTTIPPQAAAEASTYAVVKANFPDPCLIEVDGGYYAFATRPLANVTLNIQAASAPQNISQWTLHDRYDALPVLPSWVKSTNDSGVWAPQVIRRPDGTFVMYYSALHKDFPRKHCVGVATATTVLGPYDPGNSTEPLVCHLDLGGIIDPAFLNDPIANQSYLIYKNDGNSMGTGGACGNSNWPNTPTTFQYNAMTPNTYTSFADTGLTTTFTSITTESPTNTKSIFLTNAKSDGPNIESPQTWYQEYSSTGNSTKRAYHLLYDSGCFADQSYRIQHLTCWLNDTTTTFTSCPWSTLKKTSESTLLQTGRYPQPDNNPDALLYAPGGPGTTVDGKYMAFHADIDPNWFNNPPAAVVSGPTYTRKRALFIAELEIDDDSSGLRIKRLVMPSS